MTVLQRLLYVSVCLAVARFLESWIPLVRFNYNKWTHAAGNGIVLVLALVVNAIFGAAETIAASASEAVNIGLLGALNGSFWMELLITLLVLDFMAQYAGHRLLHEVGWLWRFHTVHHTDVSVDATTGTRLHPIDIVVRETLSLAAMAVLGAPVVFYLLYRLITILFTFLSANVQPPTRFDALLSVVLVTPNMHKFHHHFARPWTDMNYGGVLSIWDKLFKHVCLWRSAKDSLRFG